MLAVKILLPKVQFRLNQAEFVQRVKSQSNKEDIHRLGMVHNQVALQVKLLKVMRNQREGTASVADVRHKLKETGQRLLTAHQ